MFSLLRAKKLFSKKTASAANASGAMSHIRERNLPSVSWWIIASIALLYSFPLVDFDLNFLADNPEASNGNGELPLPPPPTDAELDAAWGDGEPHHSNTANSVIQSFLSHLAPVMAMCRPVTRLSIRTPRIPC
jgi:hypothetical protein